MSDSIIFFMLGVGAVFLALILLRRFTGFASQRETDYAGGAPQFDLKEHLSGKMICEGVIFGPLGGMTSSFVADFDARWINNVGTIKEVFTYSDGSVQERAWTITLGDRGHFTATADDVPGVAQGHQAGPVVLFRYLIRMPESAGGYVLNAFDCMYLTSNGTIVNRSQFRKFGIKVAELVATIRKEDQS